MAMTSWIILLGLKNFSLSYNYAKFYDCWKSNARVRPGGFFALPYKLSSQNTPYKLGLKSKSLLLAKGIYQPHHIYLVRV